MVYVDNRRADIERLIRCALEDAHRRNKEIETVDPLLRWARRLYPYLHEGTLNEYARTALRVIKNKYRPEGLRGRQMSLNSLLQASQGSPLEPRGEIGGEG